MAAAFYLLPLLIYGVPQPEPTGLNCVLMVGIRIALFAAKMTPFAAVERPELID